MHCQPWKYTKVYNWLKNRQTCLLCDAGGETALPLCGECEADLPWLGARCQVCALPLSVEGLTCGTCLKRPPAFSRVEAPWRYAFPVDTLINRFKHQARWPMGRLLAELLASHLLHAYAEGLPRPQLLLPVPLARRRERQRGFNQALLLGQWLSKPLGMPLHGDWLLRHNDTQAQQGLDAAARRRNLRGAFGLSQRAWVADRHVALVDDVLTTGATAQQLALLLKRAGALRVDVYCLARTPAPGED
ncbi:ComF family protein [Phytopseudomonas dryadis]|uniref:Amidophosphoribosyltransferase n=1 Tax=Phytopseudomonas dryadis TaxID=2487520 RepID=A0A4Q9R3I0_9GAMM|nr:MULTISPECIES: ComF family protein [Pseudomonas]TBU92902.1 amidophosphoribosyltransferase [Pseudomonas dryadis]TBV04645.1 amidophosphoribosyltransferase [Pseudomonas dryadis]TBV17267.1 amidophosphoribosyltransferase [Pseudomonas sp. FRB 230]